MLEAVCRAECAVFGIYCILFGKSVVLGTLSVQINIERLLLTVLVLTIYPIWSSAQPPPGTAEKWVSEGLGGPPSYC